MEMKLSQRALDIQASPIRKLMPHAVKAKANGVKIYHLNIGQPDIPTPQEMIDVYQKFDDKVLAYGPSQGLEVYQKSLVHYYEKQGIKLDISDIIVTIAGSEAVTFAMMVAANEGDEIIVPEPFYTNYNGFATMASITLKPITTYAENGFALPADEEFEKLIGPKSRAIMLCNPGNPTGTVYSRAELERIAKLCKKHNLFLISDEVYREFVYDGLKHTSVLEFEGMDEHIIMVDSVSKRYSACGARIGCIVSRNKELMAATLKFAQARLCPPTVDQLAANACVYLPDEFFDDLIDEYQSRRDLVYNELMTIDDVVCIKPEGAFYIVAKLPIENAEDFVIWMLNEYRLDNETVMAAPCEGFYATPGLGRNELRLAYILNKDDLKKAMHIFREGLKEYRKIKG
jgi:aspartate aminotransferase